MDSLRDSCAVKEFLQQNLVPLMEAKTRLVRVPIKVWCRKSNIYCSEQVEWTVASTLCEKMRNLDDGKLRASVWLEIEKE